MLDGAQRRRVVEGMFLRDLRALQADPLAGLRGGKGDGEDGVQKGGFFSRTLPEGA